MDEQLDHVHLKNELRHLEDDVLSIDELISMAHLKRKIGRSK